MQVQSIEVMFSQKVYSAIDKSLSSCRGLDHFAEQPASADASHTDEHFQARHASLQTRGDTVAT